MKFVVILSIFLGVVSCVLGNEPSEDSIRRGLSNKCAVKESSSCIVHELVRYVDRMLKTAVVQISDDVMIVDESNAAAASLPVKPESLARAGTSIEDQAQQLITDKLWNFATTRSLRYRLLKNADLVVAGKEDEDGHFGVGISLKAPKAVETGRQKNKMGPFIGLAAMKFGVLGALFFKGLSLMVGKALLISKIALLLATIIGLKKLFIHQDKDVTYQVFTDQGVNQQEVYLDRWTKYLEDGEKMIQEKTISFSTYKK